MNWLPKKYQERFGRLEKEDGLIDDCKYMLYLADGWLIDGEFWCFPVRSKKEALEFIKSAYKKDE